MSSLGLAAEAVRRRHGEGTVVLRVDGTDLSIPIIERAHPNAGDLELLTAESEPSLLLADRVSEAGRAVLRRHDWSWLDRRGHVRIWLPGVRIESVFSTPETSGPAQRSRVGNLWTPVGLEVALYSLIHPDEVVSARVISRATGRREAGKDDRTPRSVGGIHQQIARLTEARLIGRESRKPLLPDLFWETAANWPDDGWMPLAVGIEEAVAAIHGDIPLRVDDRAATLGGARIPAAGDQAARFYVHDDVNVRRLRRFVDPNRRTLSFVRVGPIRWFMENTDFERSDEYPWRIGHPMLCALRLAADGSRGREIVEDWGVIPGRGNSDG